MNADEARGLLHAMLRIRRFEEAAAEQYGAGRIRGFLHLYIGEEAVAAGVLPNLAPEDAVVATYREHGQALLRGVPMNAIMAEMFGKVEGCSRGRGGSMHLFDAGTNFYGGNAIVGGGLPLAAVWALGDRMQGRRRVTACFFGDGATAEGEFHETLNLAALWRLPRIYIIENNRYAMGTAQERVSTARDLSKNAAAWGIPGLQVDGMDVTAVKAAGEEAVAHCRAGKGPFLLEMKTYRYRGHSMSDPAKYRSREEVQAVRDKSDPIEHLKKELEAAGVSEDELKALEKDIRRIVQDAADFAEQAPEPDLSELYTDVLVGTY
jgi:pyruvate dehydrogenase E1 component alpha subunit